MTILAYDSFYPEPREQDSVDRRQLGLLDSAAANVCVIDASGIIVRVNKAWRRFAAANGCPPEALIGVGASYLEACTAGASDGDLVAEEALDGIVSVMRGCRAQFELEYPCHSPDQQRWFRMIVTPVRGWPRFIISHEPVLPPHFN